MGSALSQTLEDIEVICVDDGSTDDTLSVLQRYAERDPRVKVLSQENGGEGPARDAGRRVAQGDWLAFLDSDDLLEPTMLEDSVARGEETGADVVIFQTILLDNATGEKVVCDWAFKHDWIDGMVFCPRDNPSRLFNSFQNWACTKLFRRTFADEHELYFQHVHRTADLLFTCRALAEADVVALLDKPLYQYRVNNPVSALNTSDRWPLDFYEAFLALRRSLEQKGLWELYHDSFVAWAAEGITANIYYCKGYEGFRTIVESMRDYGIAELGIPVDEEPDEKTEWGLRICYYIAHWTNEEVTFFLLADERMRTRNDGTYASQLRLQVADLEGRLRQTQRIAESRARKIKRLETSLSDVQESVSFRIGRAATAPMRAGRDLVRRIRRR